MGELLCNDCDVYLNLKMYQNKFDRWTVLEPAGELTTLL